MSFHCLLCSHRAKPGVAEAKALTGALANAREAATALAAADPEEIPEERLGALVESAREAAEELGDAETDRVAEAYTVGLGEARPIAERLAEAESPAAARALSAELVAVETSDRRPVYDYTYALLMLALLGFLGLVFAFLLRAADRKEGCGLDLPNKAKGSEDAEAPRQTKARTEESADEESEKPPADE